METKAMRADAWLRNKKYPAKNTIKKSALFTFVANLRIVTFQAASQTRITLAVIQIISSITKRTVEICLTEQAWFCALNAFALSQAETG